MRGAQINISLNVELSVIERGVSIENGSVHHAAFVEKWML
jgi:hypothetical protein